MLSSIKNQSYYMLSISAGERCKEIMSDESVITEDNLQVSSNHTHKGLLIPLQAEMWTADSSDTAPSIVVTVSESTDVEIVEVYPVTEGVDGVKVTIEKIDTTQEVITTLEDGTTADAFVSYFKWIIS